MNQIKSQSSIIWANPSEQVNQARYEIPSLFPLTDTYPNPARPYPADVPPRTCEMELTSFPSFSFQDAHAFSDLVEIQREQAIDTSFVDHIVNIM